MSHHPTTSSPFGLSSLFGSLTNEDPSLSLWSVKNVDSIWPSMFSVTSSSGTTPSMSSTSSSPMTASSSSDSSPKSLLPSSTSSSLFSSPTESNMQESHMHKALLGPGPLPNGINGSSNMNGFHGLTSNGGLVNGRHHYPLNAQSVSNHAKSSFNNVSNNHYVMSSKSLVGMNGMMPSASLAPGSNGHLSNGYMSSNGYTSKSNGSSLGVIGSGGGSSSSSSPSSNVCDYARVQNILQFRAVFVDGVSPSVRPDDLRALFSVYGQVMSVQVKPVLGNVPTFACVEYDDNESPEKAVTDAMSYPIVKEGVNYSFDAPLTVKFTPSASQRKQLSSGCQARTWAQSMIDRSGECFEWRFASSCSLGRSCLRQHIVKHRQIDTLKSFTL